jgi:Ca-activated chloride channel homolog
MNEPIEKLARMSAPPPRPAARLAAKRAALEEFERVQAARAPQSSPESEASQGFWSLLRLSRTKDRSTGMKWVVSRAAFGGLASACVVVFSAAIMWPMFVNRKLPELAPMASSEPEAMIDPRNDIPETQVPRSVAESPVASPALSPTDRRRGPMGSRVVQTVPADASSMDGDVSAAPAAAPPATEEVDELTVTGMRANVPQAQEVKRESTTVVNAISSEDIGAVQDENLSGALSRVAKVQAPMEKARESKVRGDATRGYTAGGGVPIQVVPAPEAGSFAYQPEGDDKFKQFDSNPIRQVTWEDRWSTFSVDVDTASYSFARRMLNEGRLPQKDSVRVEEMINYFDYAWPVPESRKAPFEPTVVVSDSPWTKGKKLVHIGIKGYEMKRSEVPDANLVLLLDVSGSMNSPDKLPLAVSSMELLLESLKPTDTVAIVVYAGAAGQVLAPTPVKDKDKILGALRSLTPGGSTAGAAGIELAYQLAEKTFRKGGVNRVILATDGDFNVGIDDTEELKGFVERKRDKGIFLSVLGFGQGNYRDELAQALAQNGNGVAAYIDTINEAKKVLVNEASGSLFTIAKDVKIQVEFNPQTVAEYRLVGYETRSLKREDFNNDRVDAGDVGSGHTVTALYEITPVGSNAVSVDTPRYSPNNDPPTRIERGARNEYGFIRIRYKLPTETVSEVINQPIPLRTPDVPAVVQREVKFSTAVAGFGQLLRGGTHTGNLTYEDIIESAQNAKGEDRNGYRAEFVDLVRKAQKANGPQISKVTAPE